MMSKAKKQTKRCQTPGLLTKTHQFLDSITLFPSCDLRLVADLLDASCHRHNHTSVSPHIICLPTSSNFSPSGWVQDIKVNQEFKSYLYQIFYKKNQLCWFNSLLNLKKVEISSFLNYNVSYTLVLLQIFSDYKKCVCVCVSSHLRLFQVHLCCILCEY